MRKRRVSVTTALLGAAGLIPGVVLTTVVGEQFGLMSESTVVALVLGGLSGSVAITLSLRCSKCGQLAVATKWGMSPFNRVCRRCGADLSSMDALRRRATR
jgi:hypothetical protein